MRLQSVSVEAPAFMPAKEHLGGPAHRSLGVDGSPAFMRGKERFERSGKRIALNDAH